VGVAERASVGALGAAELMEARGKAVGFVEAREKEKDGLKEAGGAVGAAEAAAGAELAACLSLRSCAAAERRRGDRARAVWSLNRGMVVCVKKLSHRRLNLYALSLSSSWHARTPK
jgi:hypothetical protein